MTYDYDITFEDNLLTGNKMIDEQHKELIERIRNFVFACQDGKSKVNAIKMLDYLDEYKKSTGSAENMRGQIQDYIADAARAKLAEDKAKAENETLRRENAALREQLARMKAKEQSREKAEQEKQGEQNAED